MKLIKQLFWLTATVLLAYSCKKEKSLEGGGPAAKTQWEFKDSNLVFNGRMDTAYLQTAGSISSIVLEGTSSNGTGTFYLEIFGPNVSAGTYKSPKVQFTYVVNGAVVYESVPTNPDKFSVTITSIDANGVSGTFTGEVEDALGNTKIITNGVFAGKLGSANPPPSGGTGQLVLWSKLGCGGTGSIAVKVQTQTGSITSFSTTAPACGAAGTANFNLPAGSYSWEAYCNLDTVRGNVSVVAGSCTNVEVIFGPTPANCVINNLAYYDLGSGGALGSLTSIFNAANQVTSVLFVDSSTNKASPSFNPAKVGNRINIDATQYFNLDASGRITDFHGFVDATDTSLPRVLITYSFNANGNLAKAAYAFEALPTANILNITYTWTGANLTKAVVQQVASPDRLEYEYSYDLSKTARNFIAFFPSTEIFWVQSAINYGKNSTNVLTSSAIKAYDASGNVVAENATYNNYIIDANNYVKEFSVVGDGSVLPGDTRYKLSYKCF